MKLLTLDELNMLLTCADKVDSSGAACSDLRKGIYLTVYKGLTVMTFFVGYAVDHNAAIVERVG
jgi:hypothetical protein